MRPILACLAMAAACGLSSAAHAAPLEMLANGGFEGGPTAWSIIPVVQSGCDTTWAIMSGPVALCGSSFAPQTGTWAAHSSFDGPGPRTAILTQRFTLPAAARTATLTWSQTSYWSYSGTQDRIETVRIKDAADNVIGTVYSEVKPAMSNGSLPWATHAVDVTAMLAGRVDQTL